MYPTRPHDTSTFGSSVRVAYRQFGLTAITCAGEAAGLERRLRQRMAVLKATVNPLTEYVSITYHPTRISPQTLATVIPAAGYGTGQGDIRHAAAPALPVPPPADRASFRDRDPAVADVWGALSGYVWLRGGNRAAYPLRRARPDLYSSHSPRQRSLGQRVWSPDAVEVHEWGWGGERVHRAAVIAAATHVTDSGPRPSEPAHLNPASVRRAFLQTYRN